MDDLQRLMAADADEEAAAMPDDAALKRIADLVAKQADLQRQVAEAEADLYALQGQLAHVTELDLPDALTAAGVAEAKMLDGSKVSMDTEYYANISADRRWAAYDWLRRNGQGDLIKNEVKAAFGRGEDEQVKELTDELDRRGIGYARTEAIHPSTLKAFVKEQIENESALTPEDIEAGKGLPRAVFGVFTKRVAKVTKPKAKRK